MDVIPKTYPMVNYILSRVPCMISPISESDIDQPSHKQTGSEGSSSTDDPHVDPMVEHMPKLKDPKVVAEMAVAVSGIAQTRSVLRALGDRPDQETVDKAKKKVSEIESNLSNQLKEIVLASRPANTDQKDWRAHLADKEMELREAAEKEKAVFRAIIQLDEMHTEYEKMLGDAERRLTEIANAAATRKEIEDAEEGCGGMNVYSSARELLNNEVVEILRADAAREAITRVNMSGKQLKFVSEAFGRLKHLLVLNLSNNQLQSIPDSIAGLENLEELILSSNLLMALPDLIGLLINLKILNVSGNKLSVIPDSICHCRSLVELDVSFNNLTYLPTNLGNEMANLRKLSVHYNKLNSLPGSICEIKSLQHLDAHFNELRGLPFSIGNLTNLESLNLSGNFSDMKELPPTFGELINLKELDLSNNQIHALPDTFGRLDNLVKLNLDQNPIMLPPLEVVNQGVEAVKAYMAQRWLDILVEEEERSMLRLKEQTQSSWLRRSLSKGTFWLKQHVSSVSEFLGTPGGYPRDPCLDQQL